MAKKSQSIEAIKKKAIGLIDNRSTDNDGMLIKRDQKVTMLDIFGDEQKTAVAYYVSDLLAKGFNNQQIIDTVKKKYNLEWKMVHVNKVKELLHKLWRCEMAHSMNDQIAREVATIDTQLKEAWTAWEFSKKGIKHEKKRTTKSSSPAAEMSFDVTEVITDEDTTAGDVKFLQHINDLGKEKRKLLGLYAPEKKDNGGPQTAVQLNFVGDNAGESGFNVLGQILSMGAPKQPQVVEATAEVVEPVVEEKVNDDIDIDKLMEEIMNE